MCWPKKETERERTERITTLWRVTSNIENKLNHLSGNAVQGKYLDGGEVHTEEEELDHRRRSSSRDYWMGVTSPGRQIHRILLQVVKVTYLLQCYWIRICGLSNLVCSCLELQSAGTMNIFSVVHFKMTDLDISSTFIKLQRVLLLPQDNSTISLSNNEVMK